MPKEFYKSDRVLDTRTSKEVEKFMDKYYSGKINSTRITDRQLQISGVDIIIQREGKPDMLVDEKCATDYINKDLQTFSFELRSSSDRTGYRYDGWLISEKNITTHYMIIYINKSKVDRHPQMEDIQEVEVLLVSKKAIREYLKSYGWTTNRLQDVCDDLDGGSINFGKIENGYKFAKSRHKIESPVNILIPRTELRKLSIHNDIIKNTQL